MFTRFVILECQFIDIQKAIKNQQNRVSFQIDCNRLNQELENGTSKNQVEAKAAIETFFKFDEKAAHLVKQAQEDKILNKALEYQYSFMADALWDKTTGEKKPEPAEEVTSPSGKRRRCKSKPDPETGL